MSTINRKKIKLSITVSQQLQSKINNLIKLGKFSSISDAINISTAEFLGRLNSFDQNSLSIINALSVIEKGDSSKKENVSISFSGYLIDELDNISKIVDKPKSYIIRLALIHFFEKYYQEPSNSSLLIFDNQAMPTNPAELENFILKTLQKAERK